jgi:hypothetical protein
MDYQDYTVTTYYCEHCDLGHDEHTVLEDEFDTYCSTCGNPVETSGLRPARWASVAAYYETERQYGGPEEGGWWYDTWEIIPGTLREFQPGDFPQIQEYVDMLKRRPEVDRVFLQMEKPSARELPEERPRYC